MRLILVFVSSLLLAGTPASSGISTKRQDILKLIGNTFTPNGKLTWIEVNGEDYGWAGRLISQDVADKVGQCWGLGSKTKYDPGPWEAELRNMWKPTQQPGLWFHGGNLQQSRFYSQHLSLQIKARMAGISTPVYGMEKVHHLG